MRAVTFSRHGGPEVLEVVDLPRPEPGPGEVRIRVHAVSLNHLDLWVRRGLPIEITMPHIGGSDIAGIVDAVGQGVEIRTHPAAQVGTRVVVDPSLGYEWYTQPSQEGEPVPEFRVLGEHTPGGLAEYAIVPATNLVVIPDLVSFETAAAAGLVSVTAWHALIARAALREGETVLVTGASGGVATMGVQVARHIGAQVFAVTSGPENVARLSSMGAARVYDRLADPEWSRTLWADTSKRGVDVVLDSVGEALWATLLRALAPYGRMVVYGGTTGPTGKTSIPLLFWKQASILGSTMGTADEFRTVMALVFDGTLTPPIHAVWPLERVREAHEALEAGQIFGKIVLTP